MRVSGFNDANVAQLAIGSTRPVKTVPTAMMSAQCMRRCFHDSQSNVPKSEIVSVDITMLAGTASAIGENAYGAGPGSGLVSRDPSGRPVSMENSTMVAIVARTVTNIVHPIRDERSGASVTTGRSTTAVTDALPHPAALWPSSTASAVPPACRRPEDSPIAYRQISADCMR